MIIFRACSKSDLFSLSSVQVIFRLEFEFSPSVFLEHIRIILEAGRCEYDFNNPILKMTDDLSVFVTVLYALTDANNQPRRPENNTQALLLWYWPAEDKIKSCNCNWATGINIPLVCPAVHSRSLNISVSTAMARKWAQLITLMISITHWNTRQTFSSRGLSVSHVLPNNACWEVTGTKRFDGIWNMLSCISVGK